MKKEYVVIGAGPAAICLVAKLLSLAIHPRQIAWIDPNFACGDFGIILSAGSSVPGNTKAADFNKVNQAIYDLLPYTVPSEAEKQAFRITHLPAEQTCSLQDASVPMQSILNKLRLQVESFQGMATDITETRAGLQVTVKLTAATLNITSKHVILAIGAKPRELPIALADYGVQRIHPNTVFIKSHLATYLAAQDKIKKIAVVGSSHSAALAVMHLLQAGASVVQFINKPYKFAQTAKTADGVEFTLHDNTGLKGDVAAFTQQLLDGQLAIAKNWQQVDSTKLTESLEPCSHLVETIGYITNETLMVNGEPLSNYSYDKQTGEFNEVKGLHGIGIAFPQERISLNGEVELAVGYSKFWATVNDTRVVESLLQ